MLRCVLVMWKLLLACLIFATAVPARGDTVPAPRTATLNGLSIAGEDYGAPSHGGFAAVGSARFVLSNPTDHAITVTATLELCANTGCIPLHIQKFETDEPQSRALTIPARGRQVLRIRADLGTQRALYHVMYWHQVTFTMDRAHAVVSAGQLYFRPPRPLPG
jgi:hypothetical protein